MGWETIGECMGSGSSDPHEWVDFCNKAAISYIKSILGDPPSGWELGIQWQDHDLGSYPSIGVFSNLPLTEPWDYIQKAEILLDQFNDALDWASICPASVAELEGFSDDDDFIEE